MNGNGNRGKLVAKLWSDCAQISSCRHQLTKFPREKFGRECKASFHPVLLFRAYKLVSIVSQRIVVILYGIPVIGPENQVTLNLIEEVFGTLFIQDIVVGEISV